MKTYLDEDNKIAVHMHGSSPRGGVHLEVPDTHPLASTRWGAHYQEAWKYKYENGSPVDIYIDMDIAREIHAVYLRSARNMVLAAYDLNTTKALERNDKDRLEYIGKTKQYLRDFMNNINLDDCKTPQELYNFRPHILFGNPDGEEILPKELTGHAGEAKKYGW